MIGTLVLTVLACIIVLNILVIAVFIRGRRAVRKMKKIVEAYMALAPHDRDVHRLDYKARLLELKSKIRTWDKGAIERARDLFAMV